MNGRLAATNHLSAASSLSTPGHTRLLAPGQGGRRYQAQRTHSLQTCALAAPQPGVAGMTSRPFADTKPVKRAYIVLVSGKLKTGQVQDTFIPLFKPLAAHVAQHEDGCLAYELSVAEDDPDRLIIYERYTSKEYLEAVHWQSATFKAFQAGVREAGIEWLDKQVIKYHEQDVGF